MDIKPKIKKSKKNKLVIDNIQQFYKNLDQLLKMQTHTRIKQIFALLTEQNKLIITEDEMLCIIDSLKIISIDERSRLHLSLHVFFSNKEVLPKAYVVLMKYLEPPIIEDLTVDVLKENYSEFFFDWLESQYFKKFQDNSPKLEDLFIFSRSILFQIMNPVYSKYFNDSCIQLMYFISKSYNPAKEGKLPSQKGKKNSTEIFEYSNNIAKLMKDLLDVKSDISNVNQVLAMIQSLQLRMFEIVRQNLQINKKNEELKELYEDNNKQYIETQKELFDTKQNLFLLQQDLKETAQIKLTLQSNLESELIRNQQNEQFLEVRLTNEKTGTVSKIKGKIEFELSEMEEVLRNINDVENKKFLNYFINNIRKILNKTE